MQRAVSTDMHRVTEIDEQRVPSQRIESVNAVPAPTSIDFTRAQTAAVMITAIAGSLVPALEPLLLGALVQEHRLSVVQLGQAASLELLAMGVAIGIAGARLKPQRLRIIALVTALTSAALNIATIWSSGVTLLLVRSLNGVCLGILVWLLIGMLARARVPARLTGIYIGAQAGTALVLASFLSAYGIPSFGADGGFACLAVMSLVLIAAVPFLPSAYPLLEGQKSGRALPETRGLATLASVFIYVGGITALWVYVDPLARRGGLGESTIGIAVSTAIGLQIVGGWAASLWAHRLTPIAVIVTGAGANVVAMILLSIGGTGPVGFVAAVAVFGFLWAFVLSFHIQFALEVDPSGRTVMLVASAQLLGAGAGPVMSSACVASADVGMAPVASALLFVMGAGISAAVYCRVLRLSR